MTGLNGQLGIADLGDLVLGEPRSGQSFVSHRGRPTSRDQGTAPKTLVSSRGVRSAISTRQPRSEVGS